LAAEASAVVEIDWVTVGESGNACDAQIQGCFGSVADSYRISRFEITNDDYVEFLNAVAAADPGGLYNTLMESDPEGGITRSGASGGYAYNVKPGRAARPVVYVSFWDAIRFANWLHNGQPLSAQGPGTTETGAYTITGTGISNNTTTRSPGAAVYVPNEDEWYKAAYYDPGLGLYYDFPAGTDTATACVDSTGGPNEANCEGPSRGLTGVGGYNGSPSPNDTFDQGGNAWEWNETIIGGNRRGLRGGGFNTSMSNLQASFGGNFVPVFEDFDIGFRVASPVPAQAVPSMIPLTMTVLGSLLGLVALLKLRG